MSNRKKKGELKEKFKKKEYKSNEKIISVHGDLGLKAISKRDFNISLSNSSYTSGQVWPLKVIVFKIYTILYYITSINSKIHSIIAL